MAALRQSLEAKDWPRGQAAVEALLRLHPHEASLYVTLGGILQNLYRTTGKREFSQLQAAEASYRTAAELDPAYSSEEVALQRASLAAEMSREEEGSLGTDAEVRRAAGGEAALHTTAAAICCRCYSEGR